MKGIDHFQRCTVFWRAVILGGIFLLTGCARSDALWGVVDNLCMTNYQQTRNPAPCQQVYMMQGKGEGISIIQNPRHPYHFILVPTVATAGIESSRLLANSTPDYFGYAWLMRYRLAAVYGRPVPDDMLGMAINSAYGRSQNQLHIHLTCLREDVRRQLLAERPYIKDEWQPLPDKLLGHQYYSRSVLQPTAMGIYPVRSLARDFHLSSAELAEYGVAMVSTNFNGQPGFILLTTKRERGNRASVESLLDKNCEILPR